MRQPTSKMLMAFMVMLMAGLTANGQTQTLQQQASSIIYQIDTAIDAPYKYSTKPLTSNQIFNTSDAQIRRNVIQFILNVFDSSGSGTGAFLPLLFGGNQSIAAAKHSLSIANLQSLSIADTSGNYGLYIGRGSGNAAVNINSYGDSVTVNAGGVGYSDFGIIVAYNDSLGITHASPTFTTFTSPKTASYTISGHLKIKAINTSVDTAAVQWTDEDNVVQNQVLAYSASTGYFNFSTTINAFHSSTIIVRLDISGIASTTYNMDVIVTMNR